MDLDDRLARIGALPVPDLSHIGGADLARRARAEARHSQAVTVCALGAALVIGIAGGLQPPAAAAKTLIPFGPPAALTPLIALAQE